MTNTTTDQKAIKTAAALGNAWDTLGEAWGFINGIAWCSDCHCWLDECQCLEHRPTKEECNKMVSRITNAMNKIAHESNAMKFAGAGKLVGLGATVTGITTRDSTTGKTTWKAVES